MLDQASLTDTPKSLGNYRRNMFNAYYGCSSINTKKNNLEIGGRYCVHDIDVFSGDKLFAAAQSTACYPSGCSKNDIKNVMMKLETNFTGSQTHNLYKIYVKSNCKLIDHGFQDIGGIIAV